MTLDESPASSLNLDQNYEYLLCDEGCKLIDNTLELDYLTQIVFKMYEDVMVSLIQLI